jgi:hypothetical protein
MKISDFLRLRITPDNKQFDAIKNIRFYDDNNNLLVGKGTTSVHAFCESFFDYVYRNYSSARGAEKLVKSNRKKYTKFSGSENMALVQRILNEICNEYAITNYNITCEVDNGAKKAAPAPAAKPAAPVQPQPAPVAAAAPVQNTPVQAAPVQQTAPQGNAGSSIKLKALENEMGKMQPVQPVVNAQPAVQAPQVENDVYAGLDEAYVHPVIDDAAKPVNEVQNVVNNVVEEPDLGLPLVETIIDKTAEQTKDMYKEAATPAQNAPVQPQANNQNVQAQPAQGNNAKANAPQQGNQNAQGQGKNKKHGKNKDQFPDARMKPGKGYKPFKPNENFKEAPKFQAADTRKSNLKIEDIPCIAVIEENIVPTIDEVPFIGIPEDNSIPSMESVPFVGVEDGEAGKPIPDVPFVGVEDGEAGKPIPDVPYLGAEDGEKGKPIPNVPYLGIKEGEDAIAEERAKEEAQKAAQVAQNVQAAAQAVQTQEAPAENVAPQPAQTVSQPAPQNTQAAPATPEVVAQAPQAEAAPAPQQVVIPQGLTLAQMAERRAQAAKIAQPVNNTPAQPVQAAPIPVQASVQASPVQASEQPVAPAQAAPAQPKKQRMPIIAKDIRQLVASAIKKYNQLVFVGPSGTGKTYQVRKFARKNTKGYEGCKFVQFHPSYEYSDFIEGLRPVNIINTTNATNVRLDGVFKAFCRKIVEDNLEHAVPGFSTLYSEKKQKVVQEIFEAIRDKKEALEDGSEVRDFDMDSREYIFEHGVRDYYFIIDEINRADASKVFGDVMFALDEDYRGIENRFDTRLSNLKCYRIIQADDIGKTNYTTSHIGFAEQMKFDCFERGFFIPRNLHIIGTMNELGGMEADFDFSLKQKFRWIKINPSEIMKASLNEMLKDKDIYWLDQFANNLNLVNRLISEGFSDEYCLGPAFFRKLGETPDTIDEVFDLDVEPVLKEYLKGKPDDITERFISECRKALKMGI